MTTPTPSTPRHALRPHRELLIAWALLLLDDHELYGYRLHQELTARGLDVQATSLYRRLGKFDRDGWVAARWSEPVQGPRRHVYRLTPKGRMTLHELSGSIAAIRGTYSAFLDAHEQAMALRAVAPRDDAGDEAPAPLGPPGPTPDGVTPAGTLQPLRPHRELLVGWLLLHLAAVATYGYDLRRELDAHGLSTEPTVMYRMLRKLEADRWVQSRWLSPSAGPRRRVYRLTQRGRRNLDEIAGLIAAIRDSHDRYLREYEDHHPGGRAKAAGSAPSLPV